MTEPLPRLQPATVRKIVIRQMMFFAVLFALATVDNVFTVIADNARQGRVLPVWQPLVTLTRRSAPATRRSSL